MNGPAPSISRAVSGAPVRPWSLTHSALRGYPILSTAGDRPSKHSVWFETPIGDAKLTALFAPRVADIICRMTAAGDAAEVLANGELVVTLPLTRLVGVLYPYYQPDDAVTILTTAFADVNRSQVLLRQRNGANSYWRHRGYVIDSIGHRGNTPGTASVVFGAAFSSLFYAPSQSAFLRQARRSVGGASSGAVTVAGRPPDTSEAS